MIQPFDRLIFLVKTRVARFVDSDRQVIGHAGWDFAAIPVFSQQFSLGLVPEGVRITVGFAGRLPEIISARTDLVLDIIHDLPSHASFAQQLHRLAD
jgi:hypothetical protein